MMTQIKPGDHVRHSLSGEDWVVAYADYKEGRLSPCGWPECRAYLSDCTLTKICTAEESKKLIERWLSKPQGNDHRLRVIEQLYR